MHRGFVGIVMGVALLSTASFAMAKNRLFCSTLPRAGEETYVFIVPMEENTQMSVEIYPPHGGSGFHEMRVVSGCEQATMHMQGRQHFTVTCRQETVMKVDQDAKGRLLGKVGRGADAEDVQCYVQPVLVPPRR